MKKIMFNDLYLLTREVLTGRKTMTRRIAYDKPIDREPHFGYDDNRHMVLLNGWMQVAISKYTVGEVLAVAQSYKDVHREMMNDYDNPIFDAFKERDEDGLSLGAGWRNKMFVEARLMPHHIQIRSVKCEPLQNISYADCLKEGVWEDCPGIQYSHPATSYCGQYPFGNPVGAFEHLIDLISGKGTWESNPWVFAYEFTLID